MTFVQCSESLLIIIYTLQYFFAKDPASQHILSYIYANFSAQNTSTNGINIASKTYVFKPFLTLETHTDIHTVWHKYLWSEMKEPTVSSNSVAVTCHWYLSPESITYLAIMPVCCQYRSMFLISVVDNENS